MVADEGSFRDGDARGRPVTYDKTAYRGRNVIERAFNAFKHWRGLATRYDKHAVVYRGGLSSPPTSPPASSGSPT
jgi:transposase